MPMPSPKPRPVSQPSDGDWARRVLKALRNQKAERETAAEKRGLLSIGLERLLATRFDKQLSLIHGKSRRRAGFCPRRSGKTEANVGLLLEGALSGPNHLVLFVAVTRQRAFDLTWRAVEQACQQFGIESTENLSRLERSFPNGSLLRWVGADDMRALRTKRGDKLWRVVIDESQDFEFPIMRELAVAIFGPSLEDLGGDLVLTGTPGEVCAGYWYGVTGGDPDALKRIEGWDVYSWTPFDNPHIPRIHERLASGEIARELGGEDSPTYQREWLGRWVRDTGALFYRFSPSLNLHRKTEAELTGPGWAHALGWDLGLRDAMAMVVWAFHRNDPNLYEAASWSKPGALVDECVEKYRDFDRRFNLVGQVADTGGGGAMFVAEVQKRHAVTFEAARKTEKAEHVRLFNDELRVGRVKLMAGSPYAEEMAVLPKVLDWDEEKRGKPAPEDPRFPNHCCDGGLYGWRWTMAYLAQAPDSKPKPGSKEWLAREEVRLVEEDPDALAWERGVSDPLGRDEDFL